MDELGRLLLDRADDPRMAVARRVHRDAGREVEEEVPVGVLDGHALAPDRHDRVGARAGSARSRLSSNATASRAFGPGISVIRSGSGRSLIGSAARSAAEARSGEDMVWATGTPRMHRIYAGWIGGRV